jgi:hypothetical protein
MLNLFGTIVPRLNPVTWAGDITFSDFVKKEDVVFMVIVYILSSCNKFTHREEGFNPKRSMIWLMKLIAALELPPKSDARVQSMRRWSPPPPG